MIVDLTAVTAVQAVVEVIPPAAVALCAAHDRGHRDRTGRGNESAGFGDHAHGRVEHPEGSPDRRTIVLDGQVGPRVGRYGKAAADVEQGQPVPGLCGMSDQLAADVNGLDIHPGIHGLGSHVKRQPLDGDAQIRGQGEQPRHGRRRAAEFLRQITHGVGTAETHPDQQRYPLAKFDELAQLVGIVDDEASDPKT